MTTPDPERVAPDMERVAPEADLVAARAAVEAWLAGHPDDIDAGTGLAANSLTLWARAFLALAAADARDAEAELLRRGAEGFAERVLQRAAQAAQGRPVAEAEAMTRAFLAEVAALGGAAGAGVTE